MSNETITRESMFEPLVEADPSFGETWQSFVEDWEREGELPLYLALNSLARHLVRQLEYGETSHFDAVFDVVEQWHLAGDAYVREAATVSLLEGLQNTNLHKLTRLADFQRWLRPRSKHFWRKLDRFWCGGEPLSGA